MSSITASKLDYAIIRRVNVMRDKKRCFSTVNNNECPFGGENKPFSAIPGPYSLPVVGTLYQYLPIIGRYRFDKLEANGMKKLERFGSLVREEIVPGCNLLWMSDPADIKELFRNDGETPHRRSHLALEKYRLDRPNVYNNGGLLPTNGYEWKRIRRVFQKGLNSPAAVLNFLPASDQVVQEWMDQRLGILIERNHPDFLLDFARLFLELLGCCALDTRFGSFTNEELHWRSRTSQLIGSAFVTNSVILKTDSGPQLWRKFDTPMYTRLKRAQRYMERVAIDILGSKMSRYNDSKTPTLLESYLANPEVDYKDILGVISDFLLAGMETTSYTTSFALYYLATNPSVQQLLYEEATRVLPTPNHPVTADVLKNVEYVRLVLKETLRLRPVSVGIGRVLTKDCVFSGFSAPSGTIVVTQNQVACRLEKHFPMPLAFVPERWIKGHSLHREIANFVYLPFGHGMRICIAKRLAEQNIYIILLKLVRNYHIAWNGKDLDTRSHLINKPDGPIALKFIKRSV